MNERLKDTLHRWLPKLAILSVLVMLSSYLFAEYYVRPRFDVAAKAANVEHDKSHQNLQGARQAKAREARAALERIVGLIDTLDGNRQTQEALSEVVAQEEAIGEVWVTNAHGLIVYYGRHNPPLRNVADFPLNRLTEILDMVPEDLLSPIQRTAILLPAVIGGYQRGLSSSYSSYTEIIPKHLIVVITSAFVQAFVEMSRVKDGLIAIAVAPALLPPGTLSLGQRLGEKGKAQTVAKHNHACGPSRPDPLLALHPCVDGLGRPKKTGKSHGLGPLRSLGQYDRLGRLFASARKWAAVWKFLVSQRGSHQEFVTPKGAVKQTASKPQRRLPPSGPISPVPTPTPVSTSL